MILHQSTYFIQINYYVNVYVNDRLQSRFYDDNPLTLRYIYSVEGLGGQRRDGVQDSGLSVDEGKESVCFFLRRLAT